MKSTKPIELLPFIFQTDDLYELIKAPSVWNEFKFRTQSPKSPHSEASDIYIRYMDPKLFGKLSASDKIDYIWYSKYECVPEVQKLCEELMSKLPTHYELRRSDFNKDPPR